MSTNLNDDYADGLADGPSREEIEEYVLEFDDDNNGYTANVTFDRFGDYEIKVTRDVNGAVKAFDRLWEFQNWILAAELAAVERELVAA